MTERASLREPGVCLSHQCRHEVGRGFLFCRGHWSVLTKRQRHAIAYLCRLDAEGNLDKMPALIEAVGMAAVSAADSERRQEQAAQMEADALEWTARLLERTEHISERATRLALQERRMQERWGCLEAEQILGGDK